MEMEVRGSGKRMLEWDLNEWRWDGDLFIASSSSSTCSSHEHEDALAFNLGPSTPNLNPNPNPNPNPIPTTKLGAGVISVCQVQNCVADHSKAKDYHRRHKVCQIHSKSTHALVNNILQSFCQQCSRSSSSIAYIKIITVIEIIIEIRATIINIIIIAVERHIIIGVVTILFIASSLALQITDESNRLKSIMLSAPKPATSKTGYWYGAKTGRASLPENVTAD